MSFMQSMKRALFLYGLAINPSGLTVMGSDYIRDVLLGEKDI